MLYAIWVSEGGSDGVSSLVLGLWCREDSDGVSRPIFASLGLEGFRSSLGMEGYRSRDFEYCKDMV